MRLLPCFALLALAAVTEAQVFDFRGIPAEHAIVIASSSTRGLRIAEAPEAKALKAKLEQLAAPQTKAQQEMAAALRLAAGIDLQSPDNHFSLGLTPLADGKFSAGAVFHVRHDREKLAAHAAALNIPTLSAGDTSGWGAQELLSSFGGAWGQTAKTMIGAVEAKAGGEAVGIFDLDADTLILAAPGEAARMIALYKGQGGSYALPPQLKAQAAKTGRPYAIMALNATRLPASPGLTKSGLQDMLVAMGEDTTDQVLKVSALFADETKATPYAKQARGMIAMLPLMTAGNPTKPQSAEDKEMKAIVGEVLAGIRPVESTGQEITLNAAWETARFCTLLGRAMEINAAKSASLRTAQGK